MKTQLFYFDGINRSKKGTLRGLVSTIILLIVNSLLYNLYNKYFNFNILYVLVMVVMIASAISVQNPSSVNEAVVYGGLVGLVVFGVVNLVLLMNRNGWWKVEYMIKSTIVGIGSTILSAYVLYSIPYLRFK